MEINFPINCCSVYYRWVVPASKKIDISPRDILQLAPATRTNFDFSPTPEICFLQ
jgi:hypothetical protein